jgi:hypothetical protein
VCAARIIRLDTPGSAGREDRPIRHLHQLSGDERERLAREIFIRIRSDRDRRDMYDVWADVLDEWGVACPHPRPRRLYVGHFTSYVPQPHASWYECLSCGCAVLNEERLPSLREKNVV